MKEFTVAETYSSERLVTKAKDYFLLIKPSLSIMVVFSSVISYLLAPKVVEYNWQMIVLIFTGGLLVTGSANAMNQVLEKNTDAIMRRTAKRPIAAGRMSESEGWAFAVITGAAGIFILGNYFNWLSASIAALSLFLYAFIYTPLKKVSSIAVIVGAIPGALPCLIGWAAGEDKLSTGGWVLFALQFLWQFPHFWAIAWIAHNDYTKAGFKLLPNESGPTKFTAIQTIIYSMLLIPVSIIPYFIGMSGWVSLIIVSLANFFMIWRCIQLYKKMDVSSARKVMFGSYIYLPVVLLAMLADKIS
jgi:protoheme IX farnesyltransferase